VKQGHIRGLCASLHRLSAIGGTFHSCTCAFVSTIKPLLTSPAADVAWYALSI